MGTFVVFGIGSPPRGGLIQLEEQRELFTPKEGSVGYILVFGGRGLFDEHGGNPSLCEASALHSMTVEG